ncbi:aminotransferase class I/II-fold pyridoxal phosphate-dependent enzyme [bacterium]|nr:aminotransferase class I/II-fold pyridoxal phosphate-dependent enzyme [bacterium]
MSISLIGSTIGESVTLKLNETAAILRAKGDPVIHLGGGEPKSKPPLDALTAAGAMLTSGEVRYTPAYGTREMKQAILRYMDQYYGRKLTPDHVMASGGAKQAIMVALQAVVNPQEEVLFPVPYWVSYPEMVKLIGAKPVAVRAEDGSFQPSMRDIEQHVTSYSRAIMINSPNNPSGAVYSEDFIAEIIDFCEKKGLYLIMDDIYNRLTFEGVKVANPYDYISDHSENSKLIVINGVSKAFAMTGFRIGWAAANKKLIEVMSCIQSHQTSGPSALLQHAAAAAINGSSKAVDSLRTILEANMSVMMTELNAFDGVYIEKPGGTFYCFPDFSHFEKDSVKLSKLLLEKVQVVTVPGIEFGMEGHLRLSYCGTMKDITEGIERIKWCVDLDSPNELYIGERKLVRDWA